MTRYDSYINGRIDHCRRRSGVAHHIRTAGAAGTPAKPTPSAPGANATAAADPLTGASRPARGRCGHERAQSRGGHAAPRPPRKDRTLSSTRRSRARSARCSGCAARRHRGFAVVGGRIVLGDRASQPLRRPARPRRRSAGARRPHVLEPLVRRRAGAPRAAVARRGRARGVGRAGSRGRRRAGRLARLLRPHQSGTTRVGGPTHVSTIGGTARPGRRPKAGLALPYPLPCATDTAGKALPTTPSALYPRRLGSKATKPRLPAPVAPAAHRRPGPSTRVLGDCTAGRGVIVTAAAAGCACGAATTVLTPKALEGAVWLAVARRQRLAALCVASTTARVSRPTRVAARALEQGPPDAACGPRIAETLAARGGRGRTAEPAGSRWPPTRWHRLQRHPPRHRAPDRKRGRTTSSLWA